MGMVGEQGSGWMAEQGRGARLLRRGLFRPATITQLLDLVIDMLLNTRVLQSEKNQSLAIVEMSDQDDPGDQHKQIPDRLSDRPSEQTRALARAPTCLEALIEAHAKLGVTVDLTEITDRALLKYLDDVTLIEHFRVLNSAPKPPSPRETPRA